MRIKLSVLLIVIAVLLFPVQASAGVVTTKEPTNGSTVYIAGNPDMYPLEYYDRDSDSYRGILPEVFKKLSEQSKIDFSYISSGDKNEQERLAKNKQVEIVSAHFANDAGKLIDETFVLSFVHDGSEKKVYVGFTDIAPDELRSAVKAALSSANTSEMLRSAVETSYDNRSSDFPYYLFFIIGGLAAVVAVLIVVIIRIRLKRKKADRDRLEDTLTGIGNKLYFEYWFPRQISPDNYVLYYLAYITIDATKLSDFTGTSVSDKVQVFAAETISSSAGDRDFCARLSDGAFALAFQAPSKESAAQFVETLINKLNSIDNENMDKYNIHFHAGIYHIENPNISCEKAVLRASSGNSCAEKNSVPYSFSDEALLKREEYEHNLRRKLSDAINNDEFKLYVQYIFDTDTDCACGAEVLSRWHNPENGIILPGDYIELLESANMIDSLDYKVIENSCALLEEWSKGVKSNLWISCNLTRTTLSQDDFTQRFGEILNKYKFDRKKFVIEITEDMLASDNEKAVKNIVACKGMGVRIALDDFGNGYSSVRDLCDYPIDIIKVDRGIVEKSLTQRGDSLLRGIVKLAHYLNTLVLCEGVENEEELAEAKSSGCNFVQGFVFSKVYPANEPSVDKLIRFAPHSTTKSPRPAVKPPEPRKPASIAARKPSAPAARKPSAAQPGVKDAVKSIGIFQTSRREKRRQQKLKNLLDKYK